MTPSTNPPSGPTIRLKDPVLAAFLAWLIPGLGHLYQGRTAKGILFFVCLIGTFVYGCYLGGSRETGWARVVYASWDDEDMRLPYLCQAAIGLPALPALVQATRVRNGREPLLDGFMAPPVSSDRADPDPDARFQQRRFTLDDLNYYLHTYFELGTVFTMIAGLLNVLAIYDAWGGPVFSEEKHDEDDETDEAKKPAARDSSAAAKS